MHLNVRWDRGLCNGSETLQWVRDGRQRRAQVDWEGSRNDPCAQNPSVDSGSGSGSGGGGGSEGYGGGGGGGGAGGGEEASWLTCLGYLFWSKRVKIK